jgi:hypothetical protein
MHVTTVYTHSPLHTQRRDDLIERFAAALEGTGQASLSFVYTHNYLVGRSALYLSRSAHREQKRPRVTIIILPLVIKSGRLTPLRHPEQPVSSVGGGLSDTHAGGRRKMSSHGKARECDL